MNRASLLAICCVAAPLALPANARESAQNPAPAAIESAVPSPSYAALAGYVLAAPLVIDANVVSAARVTGPQAVGTAPGHVRFYIEAQVGALIRGTDPLPAHIGYVADVATDARGRVPRLRKQRMLLFARALPGRPGQVQLTGADAQLGWTPDLDARVRAIVREVVAPDAPPAITGIGNAFHVPGTLPGEGETQIFLLTRTDAPVSLQILRRPGEQRRWAVALGDIVDEAAGPPRRDTLLWYRLACGLPATLPDTSFDGADPANVAAAREDYAFVRAALGPCR